MVCFAIILASWFGGVRYFKGIPAGLIAIAAGMLIAWVSTALGLGYGGMSLEKLAGSLSSFGFSFPVPAIGHVFSGFEFLGVILVTAIPFGIYDLVEAMDNVESASAAGDQFPTTRILTTDGVIGLMGCLMGNPFILAVYIGHPAAPRGVRTGVWLGERAAGRRPLDPVPASYPGTYIRRYRPLYHAIYCARAVERVYVLAGFLRGSPHDVARRPVAPSLELGPASNVEQHR